MFLMKPFRASSFSKTHKPLKKVAAQFWRRPPLLITFLGFCVILLYIFTFHGKSRPDVLDLGRAFQVARNRWHNEMVSQPSEEDLSVITDPLMRRYLQDLSSDAFEGRGIGSKGEAMALDYIEHEMKMIYPSVQITRQQVPLIGMTVGEEKPSVTFRADGSEVSLQYMDDFVLSSDEPEESMTLSIQANDILFVGYGITSDQYNWHDYKNFDVTGKVILSLVNEPQATTNEPNLFKGKELTYYGRWMYKLEEARRRGAKALLFIHTDEMAGYPFSVVTSLKELVTLRETGNSPLMFHGWINQESAKKIALLAGTSFQELLLKANDRLFKPITLPIEGTIRVDYQLREFSGTNIMGVIPGTTRADEFILFSGHHDHLGVGDPDNSGDTIYNGAADNASGLAMILASFKVFANLRIPTDRSVAFVSFTAEETGLHGSLYYMDHPLIPLEKTICNINFDVGNIFGATTDIVALGSDKGDVGGLFEIIAKLEGLTPAGDPQPDKGSFYRADSFSFVRSGVPSLYLWNGQKFVNQDEGYYQRVRNNYVQNQYHRPSDEYDPSWSMEGLIQQTRVAVRAAFALANSKQRPQYYPSELEAFRQ